MADEKKTEEELEQELLEAAATRMGIDQELVKARAEGADAAHVAQLEKKRSEALAREHEIKRELQTR